MQLTGNKDQINVTLQVKENDYVLIMDVVTKVIRIPCSGKESLKEIKSEIDRLVAEYGYKPTQIKVKRVDKFNFR